VTNWDYIALDPDELSGVALLRWVVGL